MEISFRSKRDRWLTVLIWVVAAVLFATAFRVWSRHWLLGAGLAMPAAALLSMFYGTRYVVTPTHLHVKCVLFGWSIERSSIVSVSPSNEAIAAPATSLDRLEIRYANGRKLLLVSPADKSAFCSALDIAPRDVRGGAA